MIGDPASELIASWKRIVDQQLMSGGPFSKACEHKTQKGISFNVRLVTAGDDYELRVWESRLIDFLSGYGFNVILEEGVTFSALSKAYFNDVDLLIVLPISDDIQCFCIEFAKRQECASRMLVCVPEGEDGKIYCRLVRERYGVDTLLFPRQSLL